MEAGYAQLDVYNQFAQAVVKHRDELKAFIKDLQNNGKKIFGYGASTKGNVLLQYCGLTEQDLHCIAEVNPDKFGSFTPNTLIPIVSEQEAKAQNPDYFLVLPWHFRESIIEREQAFLEQGGKLIFPLPTLEVYSK